MSDILLCAAQATALLVLGLAGAALWRTRAAAAHTVLGAALVTVLVLPAAAWLARASGVGLLPGRPASQPVLLDAPVILTENVVQPAPTVMSEPVAPRPEGTRMSPAASSTQRAEPAGAPIPWGRIGVSAAWMAWAILSAVLLVHLLVDIARAVRLRRSAAPLPHGALRAALDQSARDLGIAGGIELRSSDRVTCPVICCWGRPCIIVPAGAVSETVDWRAVMTHELAHLVRRDHVWALASQIVVCLLPWHPLSWLAKRRLAVLAEQACDDWAVQLAGDRAAYAESLVAFARPARRLLLAPAILSGGGLSARIGRILSESRPHPRVGRGLALAAAASAVVVVGLAAAARPRAAESSPPVAQPASERQPESKAPLAERMNALKDQGWREAFALGQEAAGLPPEEGWKVLQESWPQLPPQARKQMLKAWALRAPDGRTPSMLAPRSHPRLLDVLDLGMTDPLPEVRDYAGTYLKEYAFIDFKAEPGAYAAWRAETKGKTVAEAVEVSFRAWAVRFKAFDPDGQRAAAGASEGVTSAARLFPEIARAAAELGVPGLVEKVISDELAGSKDLAGVIGLYVALQNDESELRRVVVPLLTSGNDYARIGSARALATAKATWAAEPMRAALLLPLTDEVRTRGAQSLAWSLADLKDAAAIPVMIGVIDSDNSYATIYGVGYFGLSKLTGVEYSPYHDGAWWRRWWEANKARFPVEIRDTPIPDLPKTASGRTHTPFTEDLDTADGKMKLLESEFRAGNLRGLSTPAREIAEHKDPRSIPLMIGIIDADNSYATIYGVGYFGLAWTGVEYSPYHDGAWWRRWWEANKERFPEEIRNTPIPDLPKTEAGRTHVPFPNNLDTVEGKMALLESEFRAGRLDQLHEVAREIAEHKDPKSIPLMIGIIDADNSYATVYGVGSLGLGWMEGVNHSLYNDGAWWRRWWEANKGRFGEAAEIPIPELPKTAHGKSYTPLPESFETLDGKVAWLRGALAAGRELDLHQFAQALAQHKDARAIPVLIGMIEGGPKEAVYDVGYFGLGAMTGVEYSETHDGAWWRKWWQENRGLYPAAQNEPIQDLRDLFKLWNVGAEQRERAKLEAEFAGYPQRQLTAGGDARMTYFLMGPAEGQQAPPEGWKLLLILPGGDGSAEFNAFCRRIHMSALPSGYIAAELVAPKWSDDPERTVWPTRVMNGDKAAFTSEDFITAVVNDAAQQVKIDQAHVYALGWSSSGPALYCDSLQADTPITGFFIAMSVFRPQWMPDLAAAKGRRYYLLHSPDETMIPIEEHARAAVKQLAGAGAKVTLTEYAGGHGWQEDPFGHIRRGVEWLEKQ